MTEDTASKLPVNNVVDQKEPVKADPAQAKAREVREASKGGERSEEPEVHLNEPESDHGRAEQIAQVDRENEERNRRNEAGHAKNMEAIDRAHDPDRHHDHHPPTGKARDLNTPNIDPETGEKTWG